MSQQFDVDNIRELHMETSSVCNAACPMCPREVDSRFNKETDAMSLSLAQVKERFSDEFISKLERMFMCGNYGDPAAAPECIDIFKHFRQINPNIRLTIHSNGSLRNEKWWSELGTIINKSGDCAVFSVDGLEDTNHIYRKNTVFSKIMSNAKAFIEAGGRAHWDFIVFRHNEHQVEQARQLAAEMGFEQFYTKVTRRFAYIPNTGLEPPIGDRWK